MLLIKEVERRVVDGAAELRATITSGRKALPAQEIWWRYPERCFDSLSTTADAPAAAMLLAAMRLRMPLRVEGVLSRKMVGGAHQFMEIVHRWAPPYRPVPILADEVQASEAGGHEIASFFSCGVDSFSTVLRHASPDVPPDTRLSTLLFIHDFNTQPGSGMDARIRDNAAAAARKLGLDLICITTNIKEVVRQICDWRYHHGQVLTSSVLGLSRGLRRAYIPATYSDDTMEPHGSHPLLDPLWSTETLDIVHDGNHLTRTEKVVADISRSPIALAHLQVCNVPGEGQYNCGVCRKCLRTKVNLKLAGVLEQCKTLDATIDYKAVRRIMILGPAVFRHAQADLDVAVAQGADPRLIEAIRYSLSRSARLHPRYWLPLAKLAARSVRRRLLGGLLTKEAWQLRRRD
jgi:hypothetical protein